MRILQIPRKIAKVKITDNKMLCVSEYFKFNIRHKIISPEILCVKFIFFKYENRKKFKINFYQFN